MPIEECPAKTAPTVRTYAKFFELVPEVDAAKKAIRAGIGDKTLKITLGPEALAAYPQSDRTLTRLYGYLKLFVKEEGFPVQVQKRHDCVWVSKKD